MLEQKRITKKRKVRKLASQEILTFLFFVVLSFIIWFLYALSRPQEVEVTIPINYTHIPDEYVLTKALPAKMTVVMEGVGFSLIIPKMKLSEKTLDISLIGRFDKQEQPFFISNKDLKNYLSDSLKITPSIQDFSPKAIEVVYNKLSQKELTVVFDHELQFTQQYIQKAPIQIAPSKVMAYGPKSVLDTMKKVFVESLQLAPLSATTEKKAKLISVNNVKFTPDEVLITIPVESFTEKTVEVPVREVNFPPHVHLRTFPATVKVSFIVGLSRFDKVGADDVHVYLDYKSMIAETGKSKQQLQVQTSSSDIFNLRIQPSEVEYILEEIRK